MKEFTDYLNDIDNKLQGRTPRTPEEALMCAKRSELGNVLAIITLSQPEDDITEVIERGTRLVLDPLYVGRHQDYYEETLQKLSLKKSA